MAEIEIRELEYFVAVAEELHFGRAAARLAIAQPALSKAIKRAETRLGVQLFVRSTHRVALTPAGEALLEHGRSALAAVSAAVESSRRAVVAGDRLRLVIKPGTNGALLSDMLAEHSRAHAAQVEVVFGGDVDRAEYLRDGRADLALLYCPFDDLTGLGYRTLQVEGRVALLPAGHPLAERRALRLEDLAGETFPSWTGFSEHQLRANARAEGRDRREGPKVSTLAELNQMIALRRTIAVLPRSLAEPIAPGLVGIRVTDAPTSQLVIAWHELNRSPRIAPFVEAAVRAAELVAPRVDAVDEDGAPRGVRSRP